MIPSIAEIISIARLGLDAFKTIRSKIEDNKTQFPPHQKAFAERRIVALYSQLQEFRRQTLVLTQQMAGSEALSDVLLENWLNALRVCLGTLTSTEALLLQVYHPELWAPLNFLLGYEGGPTENQIRAAEQTPSFAQNADLIRNLHEVRDKIAETASFHKMDIHVSDIQRSATEADMHALLEGIDAVSAIIASIIRSTWDFKELV